jgi:superfamily II DNA or RNA helicase
MTTTDINSDEFINDMYGDKSIRYFQRAAINQTAQLLTEGVKRILIKLPTGCHQKGTEILMYDGSIKLAEDVLECDLLMGPDGSPRQVLSLHRGNEEMAEIIPVHGNSYVVNINHILSLKSDNDIVNISAKDYINKPNDFKQIHKQYSCDVLPFTKKELPTDPYCLGVLLGNKKQHDTLVDVQDMQLYGIRSEHAFIPDLYKTSSVDDRLQILAGLLDADGWLSGHTFTICSPSIQLINDILFVAKSLGFSANAVAHNINNMLVDVIISGHIDRIPTRIPYNQVTPIQQNDVLKTEIKEVKMLPPDDFYGFSVTDDNLYVMGNFVVTHNCGKTLTVAAAMSDPQIRSALNIHDRKLKVLFVSHMHRLLSQAEKAFVDDNNVEFIPQSLMSNIPQAVLDAGWDICVLDECSREGCTTFQHQLEHLGDGIIIGLSATPERADGLLVKFEEIIETISREQAVAEGYLAPTNIHSFVDVSGKDKVEVLTDIIKEYSHEMGQTMVFVKTKKEVVSIAVLLRDLGYKVVGLLSQTGPVVDNILDRFSAGDIQFIVNCNRLNEGVDVKGCTDVLLGRQFGSYGQLNQVIGRAARPDSPCSVWELINPLSSTNLDSSVVVGTPESHRLVYKERNNWLQKEFDYISHKTNKQLGMSGGIRIHD